MHGSFAHKGSLYSPFDEADRLGVKIVMVNDLAHHQWGEFDLYANTIRLHKDLNTVEIRSTLAHEVAHAIVADEPLEYGDEWTRREIAADRRAAFNLICPIEYKWAKNCCGSTVEGIAWALNVIPEVVQNFRTYCSFSPSSPSAVLAIEMSAC